MSEFSACDCVRNRIGEPPRFNLTQLPVLSADDDHILDDYIKTLLFQDELPSSLLTPNPNSDYVDYHDRAYVKQELFKCNLKTVIHNLTATAGSSVISSNGDLHTTTTSTLSQSSPSSIIMNSSTYFILVIIIVLVVILLSLLILTLISIYVFKYRLSQSSSAKANKLTNAASSFCFHQLCCCSIDTRSSTTADSCMTMCEYNGSDRKTATGKGIKVSGKQLNKSLFTISSSMSTLKSTVSNSTRTSPTTLPSPLSQQDSQVKVKQIQMQSTRSLHNDFSPIANSSISSSTSSSVQPYQTSDCCQSTNHYYESIPDLNSQFYYDCEYDHQQRVQYQPQQQKANNSNYCYGKSYNCRTVQMNILPKQPLSSTSSAASSSSSSSSNKRQPIIVNPQTSHLFNSYLRSQII